jgi:hypothetical protein
LPPSTDRSLPAPPRTKYSVRELWVINATKLKTHVHCDPQDGKWSSIEVLGPEAVLKHPSAPGFAMRLRDM